VYVIPLSVYRGISEYKRNKRQLFNTLIQPSQSLSVAGVLVPLTVIKFLLVCIVYPELSGVLLRYVSFTNKE